MRARSFADCVTVLAVDVDGGAYRRVPEYALPVIEGILSAVLINVQAELARRDRERKKAKLRVVK